MTETEIIKEKKRNIYSSFFSEDYVSKFLFKSILYEESNIREVNFKKPKAIKLKKKCLMLKINNPQLF